MVAGVSGLLILSMTTVMNIDGHAPTATVVAATRVPGGVLDPDSGRLFLRDRAGGIDAVELRTGRRLWESREASRPLLAHGGRLWALGGGPSGGSRLVVFDQAEGKVLMRSGPLGAAVRPGDAPLSAAAADIKACLVGSNLALGWSTGGQYKGGANAPYEVVQKEQSRGEGTAAIEPGSGRVRPPDEAERRALATAGGPADDEAPAEDNVFWTGKVSDTAAATLALDPADDRETLVLAVRQGGANGPIRRIELARGPAISPVVTGDGRHVLVRIERADAEAEAAPAPWSVFSLESGRRLTNGLALDAEARDVTVAGDTVLYATGRPGAPAGELRAVALADGRKLWAQPLAGPDPAAARPRP